MPACSHCGVLLGSSHYLDAAGKAYCARCWHDYAWRKPAVKPTPMDERRVLCEECQRYYFVNRSWSDDRVCRPCREQIRRDIGEPAIDAELTPEERAYLAKTLGLDPDAVGDDRLVQDAPWCRSCILHGPNRDDYPCLQRECGWEKKGSPPSLRRGSNFNIVNGTTITANSIYYTNMTTNTTIRIQS